MPVLFVSEFPSVTNDTQVARAPALVGQTVAVGGTSVQSAAFGAATSLVRLSSDVVCSVRFGANPTAATTDLRLPANAVEYFAVVPGDKVAVIANT